MIDEDQLSALQIVCPGAVMMQEGGVTYVYLPRVRLPASCGSRMVEGLLRPGPGPDGYTTRLYLSEACPNRGQNWTTHQILAKTWHTYSFNNVPADIPLIEIFSNHFTVLR